MMAEMLIPLRVGSKLSIMEALPFELSKYLVVITWRAGKSGSDLHRPAPALHSGLLLHLTWSPSTFLTHLV